jgi:class 3 adenylate cyclase
MSLDDLWRRLDERNATDPDGRSQIDAEIWKQFGRERTVLVSDMAGFSRSTRDHGILHFLSLIRRMSRVATPIVEAMGGRLVKGVADNLFATFDSPQIAVDAALSMLGAVGEDNVDRPESERIGLAIGIASGRILEIEGRELFGNPVNLASKLGEDLAERDDVLVTAETFSHVELPEGFTATPKRTRISEVDLEYVALCRGL